MKIEEAIKLLNVNSFDNKLTELYVDSNRIPQEKERYLKAIDSYRAYFGEGEIEIFSAPGRSEIGGNHTDHQHGEVLADNLAWCGRNEKWLDKVLRQNKCSLRQVLLLLGDDSGQVQLVKKESR